MKLAIALTATAMISGSLGCLVAALACAASKRDELGHVDELARARREHNARGLLATYPRPKGHPMYDDQLDLTWPAQEKNLRAVGIPSDKRPPRIPVRSPLGFRVIRAALVLFFVVVASLAIGVAIGKAEGRAIARDADARIERAETRAGAAQDQAAYWRHQAFDASETIETLEAEVDSATAAAEAAQVAASTPAIEKQIAPAKPKSTARVAALGSGVERWRELVARYFKASNVDDALSVMRQESGGDPNAVNSSSGASGLFQQMPQYWTRRLAKAEAYFGVDLSSSILDPEANIAVSAWGSKRGDDWSHWSVTP